MGKKITSRYSGHFWSCDFTTVRRLKNAVAENWTPPKYLITDKGSRFIGYEYNAFCKACRITPVKGKSWKINACIERFIESIKYEALNHIPFVTVRQLNKVIAEYQTYYNNYRPHMGLNGFTPQMKSNGQNILQFPDSNPALIKSTTFCDGLITAWYRQQAA